jgi:hypothetical protein
MVRFQGYSVSSYAQPGEALSLHRKKEKDGTQEQERTAAREPAATCWVLWSVARATQNHGALPDKEEEKTCQGLGK